LSSTSNYFALSSFSADLYLVEKRTAILWHLEKTLEAGQKMMPPMQVAISTMPQEFQADYEAQLAFVKERLDKVQKAPEDVRAKMNEQGLLVTRYCRLACSYFTRFPHLSPCSSSMSTPHDVPCFYASSPFSAPYLSCVRGRSTSRTRVPKSRIFKKIFSFISSSPPSRPLSFFHMAQSHI
jgi:hypothetical protein